jgi:hypothetical protein
MNRRVRPSCILAIGAALAITACRGVPSPTLSSSSTALPSAETGSCPRGYERHIGDEMGFAACYPAGWAVSVTGGAEAGEQVASFLEPTVDPAIPPKTIVVQASPAATDQSEPELLEGLALDLMNRRARLGLEVGPIYSLTIDGRRAVEDNVVRTASAGEEIAQVSEWVAGFPADGATWSITVSGPAESARQIEDLYRQFLSQLRLADD